MQRQHRCRPLSLPRTGAGPHPVVLVHGFTQTGRCWGPLGDSLALRGEVLALDAPGHGGSGELRLDLADAAAAIAATVERADSRMRRPLLIGYSMAPGWRARRAARPAGSPVSCSSTQRPASTTMPNGASVGAATTHSPITSRRSAAHSSSTSGLRCRCCDASRRAPHRDERPATQRPPGSPLASPGRHRPPGTAVERSAPIDCVLVLTGSLDTKFGAIGRRTATAIRPNAVARTIDGASLPHRALETPGATSGALAAWIDEIALSRHPSHPPHQSTRHHHAPTPARHPVR
ncbi:MAG: alpha/beta fold hydrolase [Actinobacteria bacterium]|nr:alpha/beta fold hydrolase [Actinomycetota bacterium]